MKQLEQPALRSDLAEWSDGGMLEAGIGVVEYGFEIIEARIVRKLRPHDAVGGFRVVETGERGNLGRRQLRPGLGHGEAAVAGETREQRAFERKE